MPTEQQPHTQQPEEREGMLDTPTGKPEEPRFRTIAVRVEEDLHAQLYFLTQLAGTSLSEEIRTAIQARIAGAQDDPELIARAQQAREQIEREAAARSAAIAGFMGTRAVRSTTPGRRSSGATKSASKQERE